MCFELNHCKHSAEKGDVALLLHISPLLSSLTVQKL
jgi:hypothetical protein